MHPASTSFVLGYHGCDTSVAQKVFAGKTFLVFSDNDYDWLCHGVYFWEHNAQRAFEFACELRDHPRDGTQKIKRPAVVGAVVACIKGYFRPLDERGKPLSFPLP